MEKQISEWVQAQESDVIGKDLFSVVYQKAPIISPDHVKFEIGHSLQDVVNALVNEINRDKVKVVVNGKYVDDLSYQPTSQDIVNVSVTPQDPVTLIVGVLISAVVGFFLFKPSIPNFTAPEVSENKQLARIRGARNEARPYDVIPVILGKRQVVPAYQSLPYTEIRGEDEWFKMLLCVGYGPLKIENIRIGEAPLSNFQHRIAILDHYQNNSIAALRAIWPEDVFQESVGVPLSFEGTREIVNRATAANIDRVSVDFFFPRGIFALNDRGDEISRTVAIMHEYQDPADNQWVAVCPVGNVPSGATPFKVENGIAHIKGFGGLVNSVVQSGSSARQRRANITYNVPNVPTAINIRSRKVSPEDTPDNNRLQDTAEWSVIRSIRNTSAANFNRLIGDNVPPIYIDGQPIKVFRPVIIALEIKATDQLSGMLENFNVDATTVVPLGWFSDWRNWTNKPLVPTENPADCYRWLLQGPMNNAAIANERIDLEGIQIWKNRCQADGWKISSLIDYESTLLKELGQVAFTGRAEFGFKDGRYSVVEKIARYTPVQLFTPKNSRNFSSSRNYPEVTDGIKFNFDNREKDYQKDEDFFFDPTVPLNERTGKFTGIDFWGVADRDLAYKHARFAYYEAKLRREMYKVTTDVEGLVATRGDLVRIQNDIIDIGLGSGRIKGIDGNSLFIDEIEGLPTDLETNLFWDNATILFNTEDYFWNSGDDLIEYGFQIRCSDGNIVTITAFYIGDNTWRTFGSIPACAQVGDLVVYGEAGRETLDCIVDQIDYDQDLTCTLTLLNAANVIFERDDDFIPEFESGLTERPEFRVPEPPVFQVNVAGFDIARGVMYVSIGGVADINQVTGYQLQVRQVDDDPESVADWITYEVPQDATQFTVPNVSRGQTYEMRARTIGLNRMFSPYTDVSTVEVPVGLPAQNIVGVSFTHTQEGTILSWDEATDADFQYYELRTDINFGATNGLVRKTTSNRFNVGYLNGSNVFYVAAKTRFGVYSQTSTQINVSTPVVGTPSNLTIELIRDKTQVSWTAPVSDYPVDVYIVRKNTPQTGTGFDNSVIFTEAKTTFVEVASEGAGNFVYWVAVRDVGGNLGMFATNQVDVLIPTTPTGLTAVGLFRNVNLRWDLPTFFGYDRTEIFRSRDDDVSTAFKVGETSANYFADSNDNETGGDFYYWIRHVSVTETPSNFFGSVLATTPETLSGTVITENSISTPQLAVGAVLADNIDVSNLSAISANMGTLTSGTIQTDVSPNFRTELSSVGNYPLWIGSSNKNDANGIFYYNKSNNRLVFKGTLEGVDGNFSGTLSAGTIFTDNLIATNAIQFNAITRINAAFVAGAISGNPNTDRLSLIVQGESSPVIVWVSVLLSTTSANVATGSVSLVRAGSVVRTVTTTSGGGDPNGSVVTFPYFIASESNGVTYSIRVSLGTFTNATQYFINYLTLRR